MTIGAFTDRILNRREEIMRQVRTKANAELREFNSKTDHVHLLIHYPPQIKLSTLVGSSRTGGAPLLAIKEYIEQQKRPL